MDALKEIEQLEIADFLKAHPPFGDLPDGAIGHLVGDITIRYARRGATVLESGIKNEYLFIVRSGAVELMEGGNDLAIMLSEGSCFAFPSLLRDGITRHGVTALEDSLLYCIPAKTFHAFCEAHDAFRVYFSSAEAGRLRAAIARRSESQINLGALQSAAVPLERMVGARPLVTAPTTISCGIAAGVMAAEDVSTLLICDDGALKGILTDKDLRRRMLAKQLPYDTPITQIMTPDPVTIESSAAGFEALLLMMRNNFSHLPVTNAQGGIAGIISARDLLKRMSLHALHLAQDVAKAATPEAVCEATKPLTQSLIALVDADLTAQVIGEFVSSVGEAAHRRLAELGEDALGPPPVPYDFVVFGSLARRDQSGVSDQDNGFVLDDSYDEAAHGAYFKALATFVCDHLNAAGYVYCPGDIMATNDQWRKSLTDWKATFRKWITSPDPKSVMHTSIFYDMRPIKGSGKLVRDLRQEVVSTAQANTVFLAHLARDAVSTPPPLGFFRQLVVEKDKSGEQSLNIKRRGVMPITDIARLQALANNITAVSTKSRLEALQQASALNKDDLRDLMDAQEFIAMTRLRHQAQQAARGERVDNLLHIESLSRFERDHLKDAFGIVRRAQSALSNAYMGGLL
ncbi:MAG: putative nucleotidyltransferase substrate binding domain-containing protein [Pseudomonadota bacterium]